MGNLAAHPPLIGLNEAASSFRGEAHCAELLDEIFNRDLAIVDRRDHGGVGDDRPEFLHQIQRQRRPAVARLMIKAKIGIKPDALDHYGPLSCQHCIGEGEKRVDWVARRPPVAAVEVEFREERIGQFQHPVEIFKVAAGGQPLHPQQLVEAFCFSGLFDVPFHLL